ncbi:MAG: caspase family protein [Elainellaceae cyanobacterium]
MKDALTVGINTYQYLPKLKTSANDATAIAALLEQYGDFRVQRLPEAVREGRTTVGRRSPVTLPELEAALIRLFKPSGANIPQTALFYFSGHGIQRDAGIREGYLALSESQPEAGAAGLSLFWLRRLLQESPVCQRIVILDCCHSGELLTFSEADPGARPGTDRMFMVACREYEAAYESLTSDHSVLTQAILETLDPRCHAAGRVTNYSLTSGVSRALRGQTQQPLFENSGGEILLTASGEQRHRRPVEDCCPYPGLAPFDVCHADYFFGREKLARALIDEMVTRPLVTLVGPSGSGKSSLLRAGLIAQMKRGQAFPQSDRWRVRLMVPGDRPLKQLAAAFIDPDSAGLERAEQLRRAEQFLQDGGPGLTQLLRGNLLRESASGLGPRPRFVLVIDQFEELFTLCQSARAQAERRQMIDALLYALRDAYDCFRVVIGLRADFLSHCLQNSALAAAMTPGLLRVLPLNYEQLKAAILKPAQKVSLQCEPHLIYAILFDVVGAPGELPLLQYALRQLWQQRQQNTLTQSAYTALGGIHGTLHNRASQVFEGLSPAHQAIAKSIFLALTQLGDGTEDTRRRVLKSYLLQLAHDPQAIEETLEILVGEKLVVTSHQDLGSRDCEALGEAGQLSESLNVQALGGAVDDQIGWNWDDHELGDRKIGDRETVDIVHEALIRRWSLLQGWLNENRDSLRRQRSLEQGATAWNRAGQPDHPEYLLQGSRLMDAEEFLCQPGCTSSRVVKQYVALSRAASQRSHWERRRLQLALPCILTVALLAGFSQYYSTTKGRLLQTAQLQQSQSREQAAIAQAMLDDPDGDPMTALLIGKMALTHAPTSAAQTSVRQALTQLPVQTLTLGSGPITQIAADGGHLAIASADDTIRLWRLHGAVPLHLSTPDHILLATGSQASPDSKAVSHLVVSQDGTAIAAATEAVTGTTLVRIWSTATGTLLHEREISVSIAALALSPTGRRVAAATAADLLVWRPQDQNQSQDIEATPGEPLTAVRALHFESDADLLVLNSRTLHRWRLDPEPVAQEPQPLEDTPNDTSSPADIDMDIDTASFSTDGSELAIQFNAEGQPIEVWQTATGAVKARATNLSGSTMAEKPCREQSPPILDQSHRYRAAATVQAMQYYLCVKSLARAQAFAFKLDDAPTAIAFSEQSNYVLTGDVSGEVRIWSLGAGELPTIAAPEPVRWIRFEHQPGHFARQGLAKVAKLVRSAPLTQLIGITDTGEVGYGITALGLTAQPAQSPGVQSPEAPALEAQPLTSTGLSADDLAPLPEQAPEEARSRASDQAIASVPVAWSSDGSQKLIAQGTTVQHRVSGQDVQLSHDSKVISAYFSRDGGWIVVTEADRVTLWDAATHQMVRQVAHEADGELAVAHADAEQKRLIVGDNTGTVHLWDVEQNRRLAHFQAHTAAISALALDNDGRLASADRTGAVALWQTTADGERIANRLALPETDEALVQIAFSPSGDYLALLDQSGQIHLRVGHPEQLVQISRARTMRSLTVRECQQHLAQSVDCREFSEG